FFATTESDFGKLLEVNFGQGVSQGRGALTGRLPGMGDVNSQASSGARIDISQGVSKGKGELIVRRVPHQPARYISQGISKDKGVVSQRDTFKVTANLGNVYNSSGERLQALDYYDAILSLVRCRLKRATSESEKAKL